jgi:hypothetical protein
MDVEGTGSMDLRIQHLEFLHAGHGLASYVYDLVSAEDVSLGMLLSCADERVCTLRPRTYALVMESVSPLSQTRLVCLKAVLSDVYASRLAEESQEVKALKRIIDKLAADEGVFCLRKCVLERGG